MRRLYFEPPWAFLNKFGEEPVVYNGASGAAERYRLLVHGEAKQVSTIINTQFSGLPCQATPAGFIRVTMKERIS